MHFLKSLVNKIMLELQLKDSPSIGPDMMVLEINFGIDGERSLMPLSTIIMRFQCIFERNCVVNFSLGRSLIVLIY